MIELLSHSLQELVAGMSRNLLRVLGYPFNPGERLFVLYLTTSLADGSGRVDVCGPAPASIRRPPSVAERVPVPSSIWRTASAWLDVRYFFFHQILRVFLYGSFALMVSDWPSGPPQDSSASRRIHSRRGGPFAWLVAIGYGFVSVAVLDLVAWTLHYCQHRFPLLWEFHKVHHSARVMHPLTNYREHPIDNAVYATGLGAAPG